MTYTGSDEDRAQWRAYKRKADQVKRDRMAEDPEYAETVRAKKKAGRKPETEEQRERRREKNREAMRRWRAANPGKVKGARDNHPQFAKRRVLNELKESIGCRCGERDGICLDFHHRDPEQKSFGIAQSINRRTLEELLAEAGKCAVLCANCHRKEHTKT